MQNSDKEKNDGSMAINEKQQNNRLIARSVFYSSEYYGGNNTLINKILGLPCDETESSSKKKNNKSARRKINKIQYETIEDEDRYLKSLDPKDWRNQDHYAVLGLQKKRFQANENEIRQAYRKRVLKHHPDKRPPEEHTDKDSDYFTCITRAWEILGVKTKRKSYDSIDPYFDNSIPEYTQITEKNFYNIFSECFKRNERWSEITPVPLLGNANMSKDQVEKFYDFWFNFRSWREFSYEFEEQDTNLDRDERRWNEKQNKANRLKLKKEEMSRIRKLVDLAYSNDPRIKKFKNDDKEKKIAAKRAREAELKASKLLAAQLAKEAEEKERKKKEEEEVKRMNEQKAMKAEQTEMKKIMKLVKKNIRDVCKENNYYVENGDNIVQHMMLLEQVCEALSLCDLNKFHQDLTDTGRSEFINKTNEINEKIKKERMSSLNGSNSSSKCNGIQNGVEGGKPWSEDELQLLIKSVNLFPAGTSQRWEAIANFMSQHTGENCVSRTASEILAKAKDMQHMRQNTNSVESKEIMKLISSERTWTNTEQKLLEHGLKTYKTETSDRWDKIAANIPTRTKDEVIQRYKDLVEAVKAKRNAQQILTK